MLGNDYFPGLAMRRDRLLKIFLDRYRHNLDADGHWAVKDDLITCKKGIRREGLIHFLELLGDGGVHDPPPYNEDNSGTCSRGTQVASICTPLVSARIHVGTSKGRPCPHKHSSGT